MYIAKLMKHRWEEEPISGIEEGYEGTFAIFFYGCTMKCVYCQNSKISRLTSKDLKQNTFDKKIQYNADELSDEIIKVQNENVASISFITGALYVNEIVETIKLAKAKGLTLPIVYNSSGYEIISQIKKLDGLIDIYLPDFKYFDNELGKKYSKVPNYADVAKTCIEEMYRQVNLESTTCDTVKPNERKLIVRNLVLPGHTENSKQIIKYLYDTYGDNIYMSVMSQYTPMTENKELKNYPELNRKLTKREYEKVTDYMLELGIKNAYIQEGDVAKESFIPDF